MSSIKFIRYGAWAAVAALAIGAGALTAMQVTGTNTGASLIDPISAVGGPFELVNGNGETVTDADMQGKPTLYMFGFTFCPDVCPTTLSDMQGWITALGQDADKLNFAFVSVDPERDTPDVMRDYVAAFDDKIVPLTGTPAQVDAIVKAYRVYAKKIPLDDGDYTMDHSASVFIMDENNRFVGTIAYGEAEDNALKKLRRLISNANA